ncbi:MAG: CHAT domain-containing protein [Aphanothece sp. CMT-3BRIN-NPC111]|jgi:CHAT domain-containing protein|nr:CHAT domain-containing protein [Aphanothece sp. CMT-3BRIN-NPC111]
MKFLRFILFFLLAAIVSLSGLLTPMYKGDVVEAIAPRSTLIAAEPALPPASRLNLKQLVQALDRGDIAGAVRQVELGWKQQFEDYYQGKLTSQLVEADEIAQILGRVHRQTGKKPALIYAIPTPNHLELILLTPGTPVHRRITAANREALSQVVQTFRTRVVNRLSKPTQYLADAQQLYQWMIAPLEPDLRAQQIDTLIFCLGTGLRSAPLAALHDGQQFLVEKYSLGIIPAFNLLDRRPANLQGARILAMGASEFRNQAPLPAVPIELSAIASRLWKGQFFLNQEFTLANLKAQRAAYPFEIVHLATHAEFLPGSVEESYIQFWDTRLRPNHFQELDLRFPAVQLLVLSACRTALGNPQAELGFAGLAVQSGSQSAIASLWSVSDAGTLVLMTKFYSQLKTAPIKAEALRQAQIAMLKGQVNLSNTPAIGTRDSSPLPPELENFKSANLSHPYYWAAFTLIGNPW